MNKTQILKDIDNQRYLNINDAKVYFQMGRGLLYKTADKAGSIRRVGRRVLIDKVKLDTYLEAQSEGSDPDET